MVTRFSRGGFGYLTDGEIIRVWVWSDLTRGWPHAVLDTPNNPTFTTVSTKNVYICYFQIPGKEKLGIGDWKFERA